MTEPTGTLFERVGGHETFVTLIRTFYEGVADDPQSGAVIGSHLPVV